MNLGFGELVVILLIALLFVGGQRLPEIGRSLGQSIREFQNALRGHPDDRRNQQSNNTPEAKK